MRSLEKSVYAPANQSFVRETLVFVKEIAFAAQPILHGATVRRQGVCGGKQNPDAPRAKSNYTAIKQAYNSRSQAPQVRRNRSVL
jgi:hypothetical protein